jgi:hypothetical protein
MIHAQNEKTILLLAPSSTVIATNATATSSFATDGFDYCVIDVFLQSSAGGTANVATLNIAESDGTTYADITECVGDTAYTIPANPTAAPTVASVKFELDLRKRKRNLRIAVTPELAGGQHVVAVARLSRAEQAPTTAAGKGATTLVTV